MPSSNATPTCSETLKLFSEALQRFRSYALSYEALQRFIEALSNLMHSWKGICIFLVPARTNHENLIEVCPEQCLTVQNEDNPHSSRSMTGYRSLTPPTHRHPR